MRLFALRTLNDQFLIGVTGVIFNTKNEILVLKHTYRKVAWSLPGGYIQKGEHPKEGLVREIFEETGFEVKVIRMITTKTNADGRLDMSYFGIYKSGKFHPSEEVSHYRFVSEKKLPALLDDQYDQIKEALVRKKQYDRYRRVEQVKSVFRRMISFRGKKIE